VNHGRIWAGYQGIYSRLYVVTDNKIIHSHDVQFNEKVKECRQDTQDVTDSDFQMIADFSEATKIESDIMRLLNLRLISSQPL